MYQNLVFLKCTKEGILQPDNAEALNSRHKLSKFELLVVTSQ